MLVDHPVSCAAHGPAQHSSAPTWMKTLKRLDVQIWPMIHTELNSIGLKSVTPEQAFQMQKKGWTIVDVRIEGDYDAQHPAGAVSIPLYRFTQTLHVPHAFPNYVVSLDFICKAQPNLHASPTPIQFVMLAH
eukprot:scaffold26256_cov26-Tisochrysis_lutea.AAC.1